MAPESTEKEKLQHVYRLQQSKLVSISNLTETLGNIRENLEVFSAEQNILTGELENCTNRSRLTIRRLERKGNKEENEENIENDDYRLLSPSRKKSFLHTLQEVHDVTSSVAGRLYRLSSCQKYSAELLDLSVITVKHFLWRERVFMAIILGGHDRAELKQVSVRSCALGRWYDGRGKKAYSHLPAYRSLGEVHTRYHEVLNELIDRGVEGMTFHEMSEELAKLEMLSQQIVGFTGQIRHHISLLQNAQSS
ncbi:chemotaxis protein [Salmonella enterica subsp. diarizonae]|uniref:Chemotaxis protein n=2 Tax=Salmonella enterica TaxID=28901 RepID=A0A7U5YUV8_SALER|nr:CZB domain-containing protein [Salmonella enterica]EAW1165085.1 chemotaxis protein [Salmonella enterica subsp. enterica]EBW3154453.1 chemotaxis protein [Salmonella enterica subsp. enterica serovar Java]ECJ4482533.1 chemotaxis protein [Salmonella enterica subsp. diarizonae]HCM2452698.1 CZB domain-containing protein [Salmonella enterica subsp. enterica serovar Muenchen]AXD73813.1 chemotaxis protein [Salmonella enterica]